jgi:nucleoid DNA-binding protein
MTLDELNSEVATATGMTKANAAKADGGVPERDSGGAQDGGDKVSITGFGVFETSSARARGPQPPDRRVDQDRGQQGGQVQALARASRTR